MVQFASLYGPSIFNQPSPGGVCVHHNSPFSLLFHKYHGAREAIRVDETNSPIAANAIFFIVVFAT